jgi:cytochrome bd-type quinol oxidase subunit 2
MCVCFVLSQQRCCIVNVFICLVFVVVMVSGIWAASNFPEWVAGLIVENAFTSVVSCDKKLKELFVVVVVVVVIVVLHRMYMYDSCI